MATGNLDHADLKAVADGGTIHEDVMDQIFDISRIPLPFTDSLGSPNSSGNAYKSWVEEDLADPDLTNAKVDGQDTDNANDTRTGARIGNHHQISTKTVQVSTRAQSADTIGAANELVKQVIKRQQELRRDVEAIMLSNQGSQEDDGNATPGNSAGFLAWFSAGTHLDAPGDATEGGYGTTSPNIVDAYVAGTARGGTEKMLADLIQNIYIDGGDPTRIMSVPATIKGLNDYMFESSAKIATLQSDAGQSQQRMVAKGSVNIYIAAHGQILEFVSNRLQQTYATLAAGTGSAVYVYDPSYIAHSHLHGYRVEPLAKTGLADKRQMAVDWTLTPLNRDAHGALADIDPAVAWTAS